MKYSSNSTARTERPPPSLQPPPAASEKILPGTKTSPSAPRKRKRATEKASALSSHDKKTTRSHRAKPKLTFHSDLLSPKGGAPFPEVLQYRVDARSGRSKLLFHLPAPKIHLIYCPRIEDVSDIKLIRTDTTLDLSQKAEKRCLALVPRPSPSSCRAHSTYGEPGHRQSRSHFLCFFGSTVLWEPLSSRPRYRSRLVLFSVS